eukprot:753859-Hanusia_phi.AAC.2
MLTRSLSFSPYKLAHKEGTLEALVDNFVHKLEGEASDLGQHPELQLFLQSFAAYKHAIHSGVCAGEQLKKAHTWVVECYFKDEVIGAANLKSSQANYLKEHGDKARSNLLTHYFCSGSHILPSLIIFLRFASQVLCFERMER